MKRTVDREDSLWDSGIKQDMLWDDGWRGQLAGWSSTENHRAPDFASLMAPGSAPVVFRGEVGEWGFSYVKW